MNPLHYLATRPSTWCMGRHMVLTEPFHVTLLQSYAALQTGGNTVSLGAVLRGGHGAGPLVRGLTLKRLLLSVIGHLG